MAAASALVSPPVDGMVTVTQRGFVSAAAGGDAGELHLAQCAKLTPGAKRLIKGVVRGLRAWQEPEAAAEGFGGTYFFRDEDGARCGIMKPCDEEPLAPNNPKGFVGRQLGDPGLKPTVRVGEAATREVAAYLLDRGHFSRVPHTVMVEISHPIFHVAPREEGAPAPPPTAASSSSSSLSSGAAAAPVPESAEPASHPPRKLGSLQAFVAHECDTSELGASRFPVESGETSPMSETTAEGGDVSSAHPAPPSSAVFRDLTGDEWEHFMHIVRCRIGAALRTGVWKQGPATGGRMLPGMSCPRF
ncbi:Phosphatidylinositol 4-kinase gamma 5 [Auxenochlorella protothecoides]|uniref:1-phosphatidylinositol 4-kinase n=1 Tax=Auxenochlorella protothecoides TaxID=3075 RepID=A0A087SSR1_AUXPR|nr:Phosphatidylinositol 4-kinase gamma 5 [Auxenochlorella protothecoides]KFM28765.1 Phosphatidylinositol 4-kinase gamma 5 [Auxenochlorella protothecoides]